jgi:hypothetical protein
MFNLMLDIKKQVELLNTKLDEMTNARDVVFQEREIQRRKVDNVETDESVA